MSREPYRDYGAVANILRHHAGRRGARLRSLHVPAPFLG
jgi:hypothetical protein